MNLYLIGYRGSGKSTVAPLLARLLNTTSVDTDQIVEAVSGQTIAQIFHEAGERGFRELETKAIKSLSNEKKLVIALGGGAPMQETNREWMQQHGKTVWLSATTEVLWQRIHADENSPTRRPALTDQEGFEEVQQLVAQRNPVYAECADYTINVASASPEQIATDIACWWNSVDKN